MLEPRRLAPFAVLGFLALAAAASAQSVPDGSGTLAGGDRLRVPGCGRQAGPVRVDFALASNGGWTADLGATTYSGTSTQLGPRVARLTLDSVSLAALETALETDASALCEEMVTIDSLTTNAALLVNKRQTRARLLVGARATGSTAGGAQGNGLYRLRAGGAWIAVP
jgi:hypothetical protein